MALRRKNLPVSLQDEEDRVVLDSWCAERVGHLVTESQDGLREDLRVVAAAVLRDKTIYALPPPARHHHVVHYMAKRGLEQCGTDEQGFLLNDGRFAMRKAAAYLAIRNEQVKRLAHPPNLYSEDLW